MLLAIDEIVNITPDSTVVIHGLVANVHDLPERLRGSSLAEAFQGFLDPPAFSILAPMTQGDTPPASFVKARELFPGGRASMGLWPDDLPGLPAHKQALVQAPTAGMGWQQFPQVSWIFVVGADGGMVMTAVQLVAYAELGGPGQGLPVGKDHSLIGPGTPVFMPEPDQQPQAVKHALRMTSWNLAAGKFDHRAWFEFNLSGPYVAPDGPRAWGPAVTQTILLATQSPVRNIHWTRDHGHPDIAGFYPSSPILHVTFLVGGAITVKKSWERTFEARLVEQPATALPAWYAAQLMMMRVVTSKVLGELPGPLGELSDLFFDEMGSALDKNAAHVTPPWMGR